MRSITKIANDNAGKNRLHKLLTTSALVAAGFAATMSSAMAQELPAVDPNKDWDDISIVQGNANVVDAGVGLTNIYQHSMTAVGEAGNLDIGANAIVTIGQTSTGALFVARDTAGNDPTQILGTLRTRKLNGDGTIGDSVGGSVKILDRNGVIFGAGSHVDMTGIAVSTGSVSDSDIMDGDGRFTYENLEGSGSIVIEEGATITVAEAGLAAFVSPAVSNAGIINAKMGTVVMAAGETVTLDMYGDGLVEVTVDGELSDALLENSGTINASGGIVRIEAAAAKDVVDNIINVSGVVNVASIEQQGGKIILSGGDSGAVTVSGTLDASGQGGGDIEISGENVFVSAEGEVKADALENGDGGNVKIWGNRNSIFFGLASAKGGAQSGDGGFVEVSAGDSVGYAGLVDTSAANGETGRFLIDPQHVVLGSIDPTLMGLNILADIFSGGTFPVLVVDQQALANTLHTTPVDLWASETISTAENIDISEYDYTTGFLFWTTHHNGITGNDLTLAAPTVNLWHDITLGNGNLLVQDLAAGVSPLGLGFLPAPTDIEVETLNLDGRIYTRANLGDASFTTLASDAQLFTDADVINVDSNAALIQQAVHFADETDGDAETVNVENDTYTENLLIDRAVKLNGNGATLQSAGGGALIEVTADNVNIDPFVFDGLGGTTYGIYANGADNLIVDGNTFQGFTGANISIDNSAGVRIRNNTMTGGQEGVHAFNAKDIQINDNTIAGVTGYGVYVTNSPGTGYDGGQNDVDIWENTISVGNNAYGIYVANSAYATIGGHPTNPFMDPVLKGGNTITGGINGIRVVNSANTYIDHNSVSDTSTNDGIKVESSNGAKILGNTVNNSALSGIALFNSDDSVIGTNTINNAGTRGIHSDGNDRVQILTNDINTTGGFGITHFNAADATIAGNTVDHTGAHGIDLYNNSGLNTVSGNKVNITGAGWSGIHSGNQNGGGTTITGNHIYDSGWDGIIIGGGNGSLNISQNDIHNTVGASGIAVLNYGGLGVVDGNLIENSARLGIYVHNTDGLQITGNEVNNSGTANINGPFGPFTAGIYLEGANNAYVFGNTVNGAAGHGIQIGGGGNAAAVATGGNIVSSNIVNNTGGDGIYAQDSANVYISYNHIGWEEAFGGVQIAGTDNIGGDGIHVQNSNGAQIKYNNITDTVLNGIYNQTSDGTTISDNDLQNIGKTGILVDDSAAVWISYNTVNGTDNGNHNDGIGVINGSLNVTVWANEVKNSGFDGIHVSGSTGTHVAHNTVTGAKESAVSVLNNSQDTTVEGNTVSNAQRGILVKTGSQNTTIAGNVVFSQTLDGIHVEGDKSLIVDGNYVGYTDKVVPTVGGNNNIATDGIYLQDADGAEVTGNFVIEAGTNSINNVGSDNVLISGNEIRNSGVNGVRLNNALNTTITGNQILDSGSVGLLVENGSTVAALTDNIFNGTPTYIKNTVAGTDIYAGNNTFNSLVSKPGYNPFIDGFDAPALFELEDKTDHIMDNAAYGKVTYIDGNLFVTNNTLGIQHAIDVSPVNGTVNVDDGHYYENVLIDKQGIKLTGFGTTMHIDSANDGPGRGTADSVITVTASDVNIDPIIIDAAGGLYGITVDAAGFAGFVSDGNTFINANDAGISITGNSAGEANIINNIFQGSATRGVEVGGLTNDARLIIDGNSMGTVGGAVVDGVFVSGPVDDGTLGIQDNTINATNDGVRVTGAVTNGSTFQVNNNTIDANNNGVAFYNIINIGALVTVNNNTQITADNNGVYFGNAVWNSTVQVSDNDNITALNDGIVFNNTVLGSNIDILNNNIDADSGGVVGNGIAFYGAVTGGTSVEIGGNAIEADEDGVLFQGAVTSNAGILISGNTIEGGENGIRFGAAVTDATLNIINNTRIFGEIDGIRFDGPINGATWVNIAANPNIEGLNDGISFQGEITDDAIIYIAGNTIDADSGGVVGNGIAFYDEVTGESTIDINANTIFADQDGILFNAETSTAHTVTTQDEIWIRGNNIQGKQNGIRFAGPVNTDRHDIRIENNAIAGNAVHGIHFGGIVGNESQIWILDNSLISGGQDGIHFAGAISGDEATIDIIGNDWIVGQNDDGIDFNNTITNATVRINDNTNILAGGNGIEFAGISGATVEIVGNNHGIHADDHGIYFGGLINAGADIDIHDNIISAGEDGSGNGIHFAGNVATSTINIGDGTDAYQSGASNIIHGPDDGIHFAGPVNGNAEIVIDGNRIGYDANNVGGPLFAGGNRMGDDGIQFAGVISGNADIDITDNWIRAEEEGIAFTNTVGGNANILIGGDLTGPDGNVIDAFDDGIYFAGAFTDAALLEISHNDIDVDSTGIVFDGPTNSVYNFGSHTDEILITENDIEADNNGIAFYGLMSGEGHDIKINNNARIHGHGGHGVSHTGGIDDAEFRILDNGDIYGDDDGIHIAGAFTNDALILIQDNWVLGGSDDGIDVNQAGGGGVDLDIIGNHVHYTGDNGIEVVNVDGVYIYQNYVHDAGRNGILVQNSEDIEISDNDVIDSGEDGIDVENVQDGLIWSNRVTGSGSSGIEVQDSAEIDVRENYIANNDVGLWAIFGNNGYINVENNVFLDNPIHALFNSGIIDLTGVGNSFEGGDIALYFDIDGGKTEQLSLVEKGGRANGWTYGGGGTYQTFNGTTVFPPTNFGGTIGEQFFEGQNQYFVYIHDRTFIHPGTTNAVWLDGQDSHYFWPASAGGPDDFIHPASSGGILTQAQFDFLEDMFFHYPDPGAQNRGIFFFGMVPQNDSIEQEKLFNQFDPFDSLFSGLNVTITGLPSVGPGGAQNLANIAPAAGPGAGPEDLAGIEPAAGGEDTPCWDAAVGSATGGTPASINWGGTNEESLSDAAACGGSL